MGSWITGLGVTNRRWAWPGRLGFVLAVFLFTYGGALLGATSGVRPDSGGTTVLREETQVAASASLPGYWPKDGQIVYLVFVGEARFRAGKSTHKWSVDSNNLYEIKSVTEPTGIASIPWLKVDVVTHVSSGRITARGFRPDFFIEKKSRKGSLERVDLDWAGKVAMIGDKSFPLLDRTQDALSVFYQLGYPGVIQSGELPVASGTKLETYHLEFLGEESLELPFGETWRTLHVRARYGNKQLTEVWTAPDHFGFPVQIRVVDKKGVAYYLVATEIMVTK